MIVEKVNEQVIVSPNLFKTKEGDVIQSHPIAVNPHLDFQEISKKVQLNLNKNKSPFDGISPTTTKELLSFAVLSGDAFLADVILQTTHNTGTCTEYLNKKDGFCGSLLDISLRNAETTADLNASFWLIHKFGISSNNLRLNNPLPFKEEYQEVADKEDNVFLQDRLVRRAFDLNDNEFRQRLIEMSVLLDVQSGKVTANEIDDFRQRFSVQEKEFVMNKYPNLLNAAYDSSFYNQGIKNVGASPVQFYSKGVLYEKTSEQKKIETLSPIIFHTGSVKELSNLFKLNGFEFKSYGENDVVPSEPVWEYVKLKSEIISRSLNFLQDNIKEISKSAGLNYTYKLFERDDEQNKFSFEDVLNHVSNSLFFKPNNENASLVPKNNLPSRLDEISSNLNVLQYIYSPDRVYVKQLPEQSIVDYKTGANMRNWLSEEYSLNSLYVSKREEKSFWKDKIVSFREHIVGSELLETTINNVSESVKNTAEKAKESFLEMLR